MVRLAILPVLIACLAAMAGAQDPQTFILSGDAINSVTTEPLRFAAIALHGNSPETANLAESADASGHFTFPSLPAGYYSLSATKRGYIPNPPRVVQLGPSRTDVTIKLAPLGRITGTVVDENGDPVQNANIQLFRSSIQAGRRQTLPASGTQTNDLGEFHVASLAPGRYFASATVPPDPDGVAYPRAFYGNTTDLASAAPIELAPGASTAAPITLRPAAAHSVRGSVVNVPEGLRPYINIGRRGASVAAAENHATIMNAATGEFEFRGITPGAWVVTAGCFERNIQLYGYADVAISTGDVEGLSIALAPATPLTGIVRAEQNSGTPANLRGVYISVRPAGDGAQPAMGAQINEDGEFSVQVNQPGEYYVAARAPEPWYVKQVLMGGQSIAGAAFTITQAGPPGRLEVVIATGGGAVDGTVVDGNAPAAAAAVLLLGPAGEKLTGSDFAGRFHFGALPAGDYTAYALPTLDEVEYTNPEAMRAFSSARVSVSEGAKQQVELKLNRTVY